MTDKIVEDLNRTPRGYDATARAVNFAVGALIAHDTVQGERPDAGIDVERLFSAVQMLASRETLEIAPFVAAWHAAIDSFGPEERFPASFSEELKRGLSGRSGFGVERLMKQAISSQIQRKQNIFPEVQKQLTRSLVRQVTSDPAQVDYLAPLLNSAHQPLSIVTLNYDTTVEEVCNRAGAPVDVGTHSWTGGFRWVWEPVWDPTEQRVRLLKLHGSIDWAFERDSTGRVTNRIINDPNALDPVLVFGQRGKLRAEGPFLAMLAELERMLSSAQTLVVVGYSFRDEHVNVAIRLWINSGRSRLVIVDPGFDQNREAFVKELRRRLDPRRPDGTPVDPDRQRLWVFSTRACDGLVQLFGPGPALADPRIAGTEAVDPAPND